MEIVLQIIDECEDVWFAAALVRARMVRALLRGAFVLILAGLLWAGSWPGALALLVLQGLLPADRRRARSRGRAAGPSVPSGVGLNT